jgi:hypothetical protein
LVARSGRGQGTTQSGRIGRGNRRQQTRWIGWSSTRARALWPARGRRRPRSSWSRRRNESQILLTANCASLLPALPTSALTGPQERRAERQVLGQAAASRKAEDWLLLAETGLAYGGRRGSRSARGVSVRPASTVVRPPGPRWSRLPLPARKADGARPRACSTRPRPIWIAAVGPLRLTAGGSPGPSKIRTATNLLPMRFCTPTSRPRPSPAPLRRASRKDRRARSKSFARRSSGFRTR